VKQERLRILGALVLTVMVSVLRGDSAAGRTKAKPVSGKLRGVVARRSGLRRKMGASRGVDFRSHGSGGHARLPERTRKVCSGVTSSLPVFYHRPALLWAGFSSHT